MKIHEVKYKLRTVARSNGFIDYDSVTVDVVHNAIKNIAPNPSSSQITVTYDAKNAKLKIQAAFGSYQYNYQVNINQNSIIIDVSKYQRGIYSVMLYHDGVVVDTKTTFGILNKSFLTRSMGSFPCFFYT